jgi:hypothetical protein
MEERRTLRHLIKNIFQPSSKLLATEKLAFVGVLLLIAGCSSVKKGVVVGSAALGAGAIGAVTGGTAPAVLAASGTALVTSVGADLMMRTSIKGSEGMDCAPDNFFTLLGQLVETGGYALILIVVVPMLFSWLLPGPVKFKGKEK